MFIAADARRYFCIFSIILLFFSLPILVAAAVLILAMQVACMLHPLFAVYMQRSHALA